MLAASGQLIKGWEIGVVGKSLGWLNWFSWLYFLCWGLTYLVHPTIRHACCRQKKNYNPTSLGVCIWVAILFAICPLVQEHERLSVSIILWISLILVCHAQLSYGPFFSFSYRYGAKGHLVVVPPDWSILGVILWNLKIVVVDSWSKN